MRLYHLEMALQVPDERLLRLSKAEKLLYQVIRRIFHPGQVLPSNVVFISDGA